MSIDHVTAAQLQRIIDGMREMFVCGRPAQKAFVCGATGRYVGPNRLTRSEADRVLASLAEWGAAEPPTEPPTDGTDPWTEPKP